MTRAFQRLEIEGSNGASACAAASPCGVSTLPPEKASSRPGPPYRDSGRIKATESILAAMRTFLFAALVNSVPGCAVLQATELGDPKRGRALFRVCTACHTLVSGQHLEGPSLKEIWGKKAGTIEGFTRYSEALKRADFSWDETNLDSFLNDPKAFDPKIQMSYYGLWDKRKRLDLIAYLRQVSKTGLATRREVSEPSRQGKTQLLAAAEQFKGRPRVVDGDTIIIRKTRLRLHGIDAPEFKQKCSSDGRVWSCGRAAKTVLIQAIGTKRVICISKATDGNERGDSRGWRLAVCRAGQLNLNGWMVKMGWALAFRHHGTDYVDAERTAKQKRRGVWAGTFIEPWKWRRQQAK